MLAKYVSKGAWTNRFLNVAAIHTFYHYFVTDSSWVFYLSNIININIPELYNDRLLGTNILLFSLFIHPRIGINVTLHYSTFCVVYSLFLLKLGLHINKKKCFIFIFTVTWVVRIYMLLCMVYKKEKSNFFRGNPNCSKF